MSGYVLVDVSLAIKWVLKEPYPDEALMLASEWAATETKPLAPCLLLVEATNVLHRQVAKGHISSPLSVPVDSCLLFPGLLR